MQAYQIGASRFVPNGSGTYFHDTTPEPVRAVLQSLIVSGETVRIFVGDAATGRAWPEETDCFGRIGRSMGPCRVPLIVPPRASGGPALLDHCLVGILAKGERWLYRHPALSFGDWTRGEGRAVMHNGALHALVKDPDGYIAFMTGRTFKPTSDVLRR